jgi:diguanylate cyclase (GGDEF)-like protein
MSTLTFLVVHAIIWTGIWIIALNKDMSLANENFLFMGFILLIVSFCTPPGYSFIGQWGLLLNIILANGIYHYNDFDVMMVYNCQIVIMLNIVNIIITKLYYDHYMNEKSLKRLIMIDPLTQVYNRNKLVEINRELTSAHDNVGIIIVDIDHFKNINDTYGHEKGDVILQFVVSHIKKCVRANDSIIRWGGEEFVVIMPNCNLDQTFKIAERVRKDIAESDNGLCPITVSIGVSEYLNRDLQASTKAADDALYKAKEAGRNRVCRNN